jgi:predicted Rossmann fold flavoprotein
MSHCNSTTTWEVAIIGAGAAGLLAGARGAERGRRTLLLEKNRKPGVKILMSGGTRCNITQATDSRGIIAAFGVQGRFLHSALAALSPADLIELIESEGVPTKVEETGKIFPVSNKAADVLDALLHRLRRSGCTLALEEPVIELARADGGFRLVTPRQMLTAEKVILTTGGQSYPGCGTTGDGYAWAAALGHTIVPPRPALTPITTDAQWVVALSGVTVPDVLVRVVPLDDSDSSSAATGSRKKKQTVLAERRASFLFTHFGLSGPAALDVSRAITGHAQPRTLALECDFLPAISANELEQQVRCECSADGKKQLGAVVARQLPRRLVDSLLMLSELNPEQRAAELSNAARQRLLGALKKTRIPVSGARGFKKAEVTAGGVSLDEVDSHTMQSKLVPNLYLAGEILDLDGPIGGYNFQAAFSTAWLAAESV